MTSGTIGAPCGKGGRLGPPPHLLPSPMDLDKAPFRIELQPGQVEDAAHHERERARVEVALGVAGDDVVGVRGPLLNVPVHGHRCADNKIVPGAYGLRPESISFSAQCVPESLDVFVAVTAASARICVGRFAVGKILPYDAVPVGEVGTPVWDMVSVGHTSGIAAVHRSSSCRTASSRCAMALSSHTAGLPLRASSAGLR
jgi:hypothetical protein